MENLQSKLWFDVIQINDVCSCHQMLLLSPSSELLIRLCCAFWHGLRRCQEQWCGSGFWVLALGDYASATQWFRPHISLVPYNSDIVITIWFEWVTRDKVERKGHICMKRTIKWLVVCIFYKQFHKEKPKGCWEQSYLSNGAGLWMVTWPVWIILGIFMLEDVG